MDYGLAYDGLDMAMQQKLFQKALELAPESRNVFTQLIGNYYVQRSLFQEALPYLKEAYMYAPQDYTINFELFASHLLSHQFDEAFGYTQNLSRIHKELFLRDYQTLRSNFANFSQTFQEFEQYLQQKVSKF